MKREIVPAADARPPDDPEPAPSAATTDYRRAHSARRRAQFVAAGLCQQCGKREPVDGGKLCDACQREYRRRRGSQPKDPPPSAGASHHAQWEARRRAEREAAGLCSKCGKQPPVTGGRLYAACRANYRDYERRWRAQKVEGRE
jgi:hypothetical protein